jgi:hypothetical protein
MKLRNKKTGKIWHMPRLRQPTVQEDDISFFACTDEHGCSRCELFSYESLAELNEEWEDYTPAEPLIKDEKIRKAVRAWAEMNDIRFIRMCSRTRKENARIVGQNALGRTFTMEIDNEYEIRVSFEDYKECYTLAELCGEEEE